MELNAVHAQRAVADGHHLAVGRGRRDLELVGHRGRRKRVVAAGLEVLRQPREDPATVVRDRARLSVDQTLGLTDLAKAVSSAR